MTAEKKKHWNDKRQVRMFVDNAIRGVGGREGWRLLVPVIRDAVISQMAFDVIRHQAREAVLVEAMDELVASMLADAAARYP